MSRYVSSQPDESPRKTPRKRSRDEERSCPSYRRRQLAIALSAEIHSNDSDVALELERLCIERKFDAVEKLIRKCGALSGFDVYGVPLLCLVCQDGPLSLLEVLLQAKVDITSCDFQGRTAIHFACEFGRLDAVQLIVKYCGNRCLRYVDDMRWSPLRFAFQRGHYDICEFLLSNDAQVRTCDIDGSTLLHIACMSGRLWWKKNLPLIGLVTSSLEFNVDFEDKHGRTPLHDACYCGNLEAISWLLDRGSYAGAASKKEKTPMWEACEAWEFWYQDQKAVIDLLLSRGASLDRMHKKGRTVLHFACRIAYFDLVELLLERGADIQVDTGDAGDTPLHLACYADKKQALVPSPSTDDHTKDNRGQSGGRVSIVELLLDHGARPDVRNFNNETPIQIACSKGHVDIVKAILSANRESIKDEGDDGCTLVHLACANGHMQVLNALLSIDRSLVNKKDDHKRPPLHSILQSDHLADDVRYEIAMTLLSFGATPLPSRDLPDDCESLLAFLVTNFPMLLLYQMFRLTCEPDRVHLRKSVLVTRDLRQWGLYEIIKAALRHGIPWDLCRMILKKTLVVRVDRRSVDR